MDTEKVSGESAYSTFRLNAEKVVVPPYSTFRQQPSDLRDQDFDEGLGDSETGDSSVSQPLHSDPSEDNSLTDSERTLVSLLLNSV